MKRPLFWFALCFVGAAAVFFRVETALPRILGTLLVWGFCALAARGGRRGAILLLAAALLSNGYALLRQELAQRRYDPLIGRTLTGTLAVETAEAQRGGVLLSGKARLLAPDGKTFCADALLTERGDQSAGIGETLSFTAILRSQKNGELSLLCERVLKAGPAAPQPAAALAALRRRVSLAAGEAVYGEARGVLTALLTGDRSALADATVRDFRRAGMSHLLVVSGMHLSLAAALFSILPLRKRRLRALLTIALVWLLALFTGLGVSALRAALLLTMTQTASLFSRRGDPLTSLAFACLVIVLISPQAVAGAAFPLSAGSTLGIVLLSDRASEALRARLPRMLAPLARPFSVGLAAQLGVLPVLALSFGTIPLIGLFANLLAVPLLMPILLCGASAVAAAPLRPVFGAVCQALIRLLCAIAHAAARIPFAQIGIGERWALCFLLGAYALAALGAILRPARRRLLALALAAACSVCLTVTVVGAGQSVTVSLLPQDGVAILVRGQRAAVIGCPQDRWVAERTADLLRRQNVRTIECLWTDGALSLPAVSLGEEFRLAAIAAPDTPQNRSLCRGAGIALCFIAREARLLGCVRASFGVPARIFLGEGDALCQIGENCVIMGKTGRVLPPLGEAALRFRVPLRRLP